MKLRNFGDLELGDLFQGVLTEEGIEGYAVDSIGYQKDSDTEAINMKTNKLVCFNKSDKVAVSNDFSMEKLKQENTDITIIDLEDLCKFIGFYNKELKIDTTGSKVFESCNIPQTCKLISMEICGVVIDHIKGGCFFIDITKGSDASEDQYIERLRSFVVDKYLEVEHLFKALCALGIIQYGKILILNNKHK